MFDNIHINLKNIGAFEWHKEGDSFFIGYFFDLNNELRKNGNALNYLTELIEKDRLTSTLKKLNGIFAFVIKSDDKYFIYTDKTRFFHLFYSQINGIFHVTDDFYSFQQINHQWTINEEARIQFLASAFTFNKLTLVNDIYQVMPGELITASNNKIISSQKVHSFVQNETTTLKKDKDHLLNRAYELFEKSGNRLIKSLEGRPVALPLSGGFDSRLIACWLKVNGIENVVCFTYGRKDITEVKTSQRVAETLGYKWYYIEYNDELIKDFKDDTGFQSYYKTLSQGTSMFYMQEYFAVKYLIDNNIVNRDFVAIPGHSGDALGGSLLHKSIPIESKISKVPFLLNRNFCNYYRNDNNTKCLLNRAISGEILLFEQTTHSYSYTIAENWLYLEKIPKYIMNSSHVFSHFGMQVRLPFWDNELTDFWFSVPLKFRLGKTLFDSVIHDRYFKPLGVRFSNDSFTTVKTLKKQQLKERLKNHLPVGTRQRYTKKNDVFYYDEITQIFLDELIKNGVTPFNNGNQYIHRILNWYLLKLNNDFSII
ncbi:MAG: asparagine synthetase B family protein [Bacteroidales bacterium]|nr:asparagine synthetase B family protein [Bacteroidales bacterium]